MPCTWLGANWKLGPMLIDTQAPPLLGCRWGARVSAAHATTATSTRRRAYLCRVTATTDGGEEAPPTSHTPNNDPLWTAKHCAAAPFASTTPIPTQSPLLMVTSACGRQKVGAAGEVLPPASTTTLMPVVWTCGANGQGP